MEAIKKFTRTHMSRKKTPLCVTRCNHAQNTKPNDLETPEVSLLLILHQCTEVCCRVGALRALQHGFAQESTPAGICNLASARKQQRGEQLRLCSGVPTTFVTGKVSHKLAKTKGLGNPRCLLCRDHKGFLCPLEQCGQLRHLFDFAIKVCPNYSPSGNSSEAPPATKVNRGWV